VAGTTCFIIVEDRNDPDDKGEYALSLITM